MCSTNDWPSDGCVSSSSRTVCCWSDVLLSLLSIISLGGMSWAKGFTTTRSFSSTVASSDETSSIDTRDSPDPSTTSSGEAWLWWRWSCWALIPPATNTISSSSTTNGRPDHTCLSNCKVKILMKNKIFKLRFQNRSTGRGQGCQMVFEE